MNDDWRLRITLGNETQARELSDRLESRDLEHDLSTRFTDRVIVSRDDNEVFAYAASRQQAEAVGQLVRTLAKTRGWQAEYELKHWHPTAEAWENADVPLPHSETERAAEHAELIEQEQQESREQGFPEYEVRVRCRSHADARRLAEQLRTEGIPNVHRWEFVVVGAADEDSAKALADRIRGEAPAGADVTAEGSAEEVIAEAPFATPFNDGPFAVFGGLAG